MSLLGLGLFDYPKEIRQVKAQLPESDRSTFIKAYKKLSKQEKISFKDALKKADANEASQIIGKDLTKIKLDQTANNMNKSQNVKGLGKKTSSVVPNNLSASSTNNISSSGDIIDRTNRILAVPTSIDSDLVAQAAVAYERAVPSRVVRRGMES